MLQDFDILIWIGFSIVRPFLLVEAGLVFAVNVVTDLFLVVFFAYSECIALIKNH